MSRAARAWIVFGAGVLAGGVALVWITSALFVLERGEQRARAVAAHEEAVRSAMWRMDSWLSVFLAREAARPVSEYRTPVGRDEPAPLARQTSEYLSLYVEIDAQGRVGSPQLPPAPYASAVPLTTERLAAWHHATPYLDAAEIGARIERAETLETTKLAGVVRKAPGGTTVDAAVDPHGKTLQEYEARVSCAVPPAPASEHVGRLVPMWLDGPAGGGDPLLVFMRRVEEGNEQGDVQVTRGYQGFVVQWPRLRERLLVEIQDLFPAAELERVEATAGALDPRGRYLANIPIALQVGNPQPLPTPWLTPARAALVVSWAAALAATIAIAFTLRATLGLAERRRRFASAVTHELRTPLTTFRLYTEMLGRGVVRDPEQRRQYIETLHAESGRLSSLVDNVLAHARLEQGRARARPVSTTFTALMERLRPSLERCADAAGVELELVTPQDGKVPLAVDADAVDRVLCNLVDNAGKYARNGGPPSVRIEAVATASGLRFSVRDRGPGVPPERARAVFEPFDRGGRDASDPVPGIGLGLALARDLARDMGGDLTLRHPEGGGACFLLELPTRARTRR